MQFVIASTFQRALARLDNQSARAVKTTAFDLQSDPAVTASAKLPVLANLKIPT